MLCVCAVLFAAGCSNAGMFRTLGIYGKMQKRQMCPEMIPETLRLHRLEMERFLWLIFHGRTCGADDDVDAVSSPSVISREMYSSWPDG